MAVWDLGRVAIGLLNLKYFTPTVEMLDESIRVIGENQEMTTTPTQQQRVRFSLHPSPLIIPAIINENIRSEDLLDIKLTAMKQVSLIVRNLIGLLYRPLIPSKSIIIFLGIPKRFDPIICLYVTLHNVRSYLLR